MTRLSDIRHAWLGPPALEAEDYTTAAQGWLVKKATSDIRDLLAVAEAAHGLVTEMVVTVEEDTGHVDLHFAAESLARLRSALEGLDR